MRENSQGLMEALREKVGTEVFSEAMRKVTEGVRDRRLRRSSKRKIEAVSMPERSGEQKRKKGERKKERRKEKGQEHSRRRAEY